MKPHLRHSLVRQLAAPVAIALLSTAFQFASAAPGQLDPAFGVGGKMTTRIFATGDLSEARPRALAIQKDGKILVAGSYQGIVDDFLVVRYNADGSLDLGFGSNGFVVTDFFGQEDDDAAGIAIQKDGKIVVGGSAYLGLNAMGDPNLAFALARYNSDGSLDSTFGVGGKVTTDFFDNLDEGTNVLLQRDGKIVLSGFVTQGPNTGSTYNFAVARYDKNGVLDPTFGDQGKTITDFNGNGDIAEWSALQADGKIILVGTAFSSATHTDFALARYNTNGTLDLTFNNTGKVTTNFAAANDEYARSVAIAADGKIVVGGRALNAPILSGGKSDFAAARYNTDGTLDTTFDGDGRWTSDISGTNDSESADAVTVLKNGKIVLAGISQFFAVTGGGSTDYAIVQLQPNGAFDNRFGNNGKVYTDFGEFDPDSVVTGDSAGAILVQRDGKIVVAGYSVFERYRNDVSIARYLER